MSLVDLQERPHSHSEELPNFVPRIAIDFVQVLVVVSLFAVVSVLQHHRSDETRVKRKPRIGRHSRRKRWEARTLLRIRCFLIFVICVVRDDTIGKSSGYMT